MKKRRVFSAEFKSNVALVALFEQQPTREIAERHLFYPGQVTEWKVALLSNASSVFEKPAPSQVLRTCSSRRARTGSIWSSPAAHEVTLKQNI